MGSFGDVSTMPILNSLKSDCYSQISPRCSPCRSPFTLPCGCLPPYSSQDVSLQVLVSLERNSGCERWSPFKVSPGSASKNRFSWFVCSQLQFLFASFLLPQLQVVIQGSDDIACRAIDLLKEIYTNLGPKLQVNQVSWASVKGATPL